MQKSLNHFNKRTKRNAPAQASEQKKYIKCSLTFISAGRKDVLIDKWIFYEFADNSDKISAHLILTEKKVDT